MGAYRQSRPKQGGWLQGRALTGASQGARNTILVDLFVQYAASAGLLSSPNAHATSCFWKHSPLGLRFHLRAASCAGPGTNPCAATLASIGSGMLFWPRCHTFFVFLPSPQRLAFLSTRGILLAPTTTFWPDCQWRLPSPLLLFPTWAPAPGCRVLLLIGPDTPTPTQSN